LSPPSERISSALRGFLARVIFRTADVPSLLPGRLAPEILARWHYHAPESTEFTRRDRSSIYGGFHLYSLIGSA